MTQQIGKAIDYYEMFGSLVLRSAGLTKQRDELNVEISKLQQLIVALFPLIPEEKQELYKKEIEEMDEANSLGLSEAIALVFSTHESEWMTASTVREYLEEIGFDFRQYRANPLAAITTTVKRLVPQVLQSTQTRAGTLYIKRLTIGDRIAGKTEVPPPPDDLEDAPKNAFKSRKLSDLA